MPPAPFVEKYKPRRISEIIGNREQIQQLIDWIGLWRRGPPKKRGALIYGPTGVGKTVTVETVAEELGSDIVEMNASDHRTAKMIGRVAGSASEQGTLTGANLRIVLIDEVDGVASSTDRGAVGAIVDLVQRARCPVILTMNGYPKAGLAPLRRCCLLLEFSGPPVSSFLQLLERVCALEGIEADLEALRLIAERSEGDVRSALNDLQFLALRGVRLDLDEVTALSFREREARIFDVLRGIFGASSCLGAKRAVYAADIPPVDVMGLGYDTVFEWLYENIPYQLTDPSDLCRALESLAKADVYKRRIKDGALAGDTGSWSLLPYLLDHITVGVAMSRSQPWTDRRMNYPERARDRFRTVNARRLLESIGMRLGEQCHVSASTAVREYLPYLRFMFRNNVRIAAEASKRFGFDKPMIVYLAGGEGKAAAILSLVEGGE